MKELQTAPESLFWYWISERHAIYLRRQSGQPKPWTADRILIDYKFTNPFRENDRGTVWLRENFLEPHREIKHTSSCVWFYCDPEGGEQCDCGANEQNLQLLAFNICWYRMFNWWGTGEFLGWQTGWQPNMERQALAGQLADGKQVFTGAHIIYSPPGLSKIDAIVDVCTDLYNLRKQIAATARKNRSLQTVFDLLQTVHCVGGFMAYEMVSDMRHTRLLEDATDIMIWANPGPGAKRGLRRLGMPSSPDKKAIESMQLLLSRSEERPNALPVDFPLLEMRDIEHSLCEFDKYCRVKFGEGEPRSKFNGRV